MGASRAAEAAEPQRVVHDAHSGLPTVAAAPQRADGALRSGCQCGMLNVVSSGHEIEGEFIMSNTFDMSVTCRLIRLAARNGSVISYDDVAKAHGMTPKQDKQPLFDHLGHLLRVSFQLGLPALSAVVVREGRKELDEQALFGFACSAEKAGYKFKGKEKFAREQKEATFEWAHQLDARSGSSGE